jgi:hypothetical protein
MGCCYCRKEFIEKYGEAAVPNIPWLALANPIRYHMYVGPMADCPQL